MGQRSQIYIHLNIQQKEANPHYIPKVTCYQGFLARYFQWNYGERMVSRARAILEHISAGQYLKYPWLVASKSDHEKLCRICDVNFDMRDIQMSSDILQEINDWENGDMSGLFAQDNNDGQLLIKVTEDGMKYAFIYPDDDGEVGVYDASGYLDQDIGTPWETNESIGHEELEYTQNNIRVIEELATLMTKEEVDAFLAADYSPFLAQPFFYTDVTA